MVKRKKTHNDVIVIHDTCNMHHLDKKENVYEYEMIGSWPVAKETPLTGETAEKIKKHIAKTLHRYKERIPDGFAFLIDYGPSAQKHLTH